MSRSEASQAHATPYLLFMVLLSVFSLVLLAVDVTFTAGASFRSILRGADTALCVLFFADFLVTLFRSRDRRRYLATWGWVDLVSSIPVISVFRLGRVARIARIIRVFRAVRSVRAVVAVIVERRAQSAMLAAALLAIVFVVFGSIAILQVEQVEGANITSPQDAVWWTVVTLTTVGYGDRYPVTAEGRVVATILMVAGLGLFGTLSGFIAAGFLSPANRERESELDAVREEIRQLRHLMETQKSERAE